MSFLYSGDFQISEFIENEIKKAIRSDNKQKLAIDGQSTRTNMTHINMAVDFLIDFLRVADEYLLEELKNNCQNELIKLIDENTYQTISEMGELYNSDRIVEYCQWFQRRKISQYNLHDQSTSNGGSGGTENSNNGSAGWNSLSSTAPQKSKY